MVDFTPGAGTTSGLPALPQPIRWLVTGAVRHAVVGAGVWLLSEHILTSAQQTAFDNWGTDTVLVVLGLAWSFMSHKAAVAQSTTST